MGMARPRTPTKTLETRGAFKKHPERLRENEPQPMGPIGDPPSCLTKKQKEIWYELVANTASGVLTNMDRPILEVATRLLHTMRKRSAQLTASDFAQLRGTLGQLGMTPADRSRVTITPIRRGGGSNPFQGFGADA